MIIIKIILSLQCSQGVCPPVLMHNSTKGFTHGCTEVETTLFDMLVFYRERGHKKIDVRVQYPSKNHKTNGGTKR